MCEHIGTILLKVVEDIVGMRDDRSILFVFIQEVQTPGVCCLVAVK